MLKRLSITIALLLAGLLLHAQQLELPAISPGDQVIYHTHYTLSYDEAHEQAEWVAYELTRPEVDGSFDRTDNFRRDTSVQTGSAGLDDYRGSGYDRGHLAPAADMAFDAQAMSESFYFSNMSPQDPSFNRGIWKLLEGLVRDWAVNEGSIYVVTGPIFGQDQPTIGPNQVTVPEGYYKAILYYLPSQPAEAKAIGFILPNERGMYDIKAYAVSIDQIEIATGIDFYHALPDTSEEDLEATYDLSLWSFDGTRIASSEVTPASPQASQGNPAPATPTYWINSSNGTRHNSGCRYYGETKNGYFTTDPVGDPCGICGG